MVEEICSLLDRLAPADRPRRELIAFIKDRPGHDQRYAIDFTRIRKELDWQPRESFETGLEKTVQWYLENSDWVERVSSGAYKKWVDEHYKESPGKENSHYKLSGV